ncbi:MAG: flagellar basal-body MS-ring/collar protein FliF [Cyanobacteriota bacterium]
MNIFLEQFKKWWEARSFGQRFTLIFLIIAFVGVVTYLFSITNQPDWDILYDDLAPSDAASVAAHLKENGILHRIANEGKTVLVPKEVIAETRLNIAQDDIIKQDVIGLDALDKLPIGLNKEQQTLWRLRMIQGELSRTISVIKGVKSAKVSIAEPERTIFTSEDETPSASVMLTLSPGIKLKQEQIKAIKNLVSHSVARLSPDKVFVSDQSGNALSEDISSSSSSLDDLRISYEKKIEKKIKDLISPLVGNENVTVAVTAEMNFDKTTSQIERYIPTTQNADGNAAGVLVSEQLLGENYTGQDGKAPGGVPGTTSNITNPTYVTSGGDGAGKSSDYTKNSTIKNFEVSKEIKNITYAPGQVERLTVAVAVNKVLTTDEHTEIEKLIKTAAGADVARGDIITVTGMSFAGLDQIEEKRAQLQEQAKMDSLFSAVEAFGPYLLVVVFGGTTLLIFWSLLKRPIEAVAIEEYAEETYDFPDVPDVLEAASIPVIEAKLDPEIERMREEINAFVMNDAAEAARLLLSFIKE